MPPIESDVQQSGDANVYVLHNGEIVVTIFIPGEEGTVHFPTGATESQDSAVWGSHPAFLGNEDVDPTESDDGSFFSGNRSSLTYYMRGNFFGPDHKEVSGVFKFEHLVGAFGAIRQERVIPD